MKKVRVFLEGWPKVFIHISDLATFLDRSENACYKAISRAVKSALLVRIRRGLYLVAHKIKQRPLDEFELALFIYDQSFVSLESVLVHCGWISESVYTTTCVTSRRAKEFHTAVGSFIYKHVPKDHFHVGVDRIETKSGELFIASPWRAVADLVYTQKKNYQSLKAFEEDLKVEREILLTSDIMVLEELANKYPSSRVRKVLKRFLRGIRSELK